MDSEILFSNFDVEKYNIVEKEELKKVLEENKTLKQKNEKLLKVIKFLNKLQLQAEDPSNNKVSTPKNIKLLTEINDSLKDLNKNLTKKN